jgi:hypothetical protein
MNFIGALFQNINDEVYAPGASTIVLQSSASLTNQLGNMLAGNTGATTGQTYSLSGTWTGSTDQGYGTIGAIKSATSSGGGGTTNGWGTMDVWMRCNTSSPGTTLTSTILAACDQSGQLTSWNLAPNPPYQFHSCSSSRQHGRGYQGWSYDISDWYFYSGALALRIQ